MRFSDGIEHLSTETLFREHAGFVARFLTRLGVPSAQLEDALQEVFLVAHRNGGYRPGIASPTTYLANIAVRAACSHRRRNGRRHRRHSEAPVEHMPSGQEDPAHALQVRQDLQRLHRALERLPETLRTTLLLVDVEGESCVSVAAGLGCPVGTVYWRLHQARGRLETALRRVDAEPRPAGSTPYPETQGRRPLPARSVIVLFGLRANKKASAQQLLELARQTRETNPQLEQRLALHRQLVEAGTELPCWASSAASQTTTWWGVIGVGPMVAGTVLGGVVVVAVLLGSSPSEEPLPAPPARSTVDPAAVSAVGAAPPALQPTLPEAEVEALMAGWAPLRDEVESRPRVAKRASGGLIGRAVRAARDRGSLRTAKSSVGVATTTTTTKSTATATATGVELEAGGDEAAFEPAGQPDHEANSEPASQATVKPPPSDLELAEMREIARAERALEKDPGRTLTIVRSMPPRFPDSYFDQERAYLEIMALFRLGRTHEMRDRAEPFLNAHSNGPYGARVRRALASADR